MDNLIKLNQRRWAAQLALTTGLALLFLAALLWGLRGVTPARADPGNLYVDGASGQDVPTCGTTITPCQTISYTLNSRASGGDTIRVAQGVYTENLIINISVTLEGGYEPISWTRSITQYETILDGSGSQTVVGDWDGNMLAFSRVISDSGQYWMWYNGQSLTYPGWGWTLGLATSPDGLDWTKHGSNPILEPGSEGAWDSGYRGQVAVLKGDGLYEMWYSGSDGGPWQTGYATSTNGIDWNIYAGNPVLTVGGGGSWDEQEANAPTVIEDGGLYQMWYHGCNPDYSVCSIGYATSTNGLDWSKHAGNPVLTGTEGGWDEGTALWPSVVKDGSTYKMWYYGGGGKVGLATSPDGVNWTKEATNPILTEGWDGGGAYAHTVMLEGGTYRMWLNSGTGGSRGIGYAESTDGISWTLSISNPVLTPGMPGQWGDPVVRFEAGSDGAVLDGFTITGGDAENGGGVLIDGVSADIANSTVTGNVAGHGGGGVMVDNHAQAQIANVVVEHNSADYGGGIAVRSGASAFISGTRIISNTANESGGGIGIWHDGPAVVMANTVISDNYGYGAGGLAMWEPGGTFTGTNLLVVDNRSGPGPAGIALWGSSGGQLMNVTVSGNDSATGFDGAEVEGPVSGFPIVNSIFWGNGTSNANLAGSNLDVTYSDVGSGWTGTGNIDADPLFVDAANGDYHLQVGSPCIDAGMPASAPTHDIEGTPRDPAPDMGAYEWTGFRIFLPLTLTNLP